MGRVYDIQGTVLFMTSTYTYEVIGFSNDSGRATVRDKYNGATREVYCDSIPR